MEFTEDEWEKLNAIGVTTDNLDDQSFKNICDTLQPLPDREKVLRRMFFGATALASFEDPLQSFRGIAEAPIFKIADTYAKIAGNFKFDVSTGLNQLFEKSALQAVLECNTNNILGRLPAGMKAVLEPAELFAKELTDPLLPYFKTASVINDIIGTSDQLYFKAINPVLGANASLFNVTEQFKPYETLLLNNKAILDPTNGLGGFFNAGSLLAQYDYQKLNISGITQSFSINGVEKYSTGLYDDLKATGFYTSMGEVSLSKFEWAGVGKKIEIPDAVTHFTQHNFLGFAKDYSAVLESVTAKPNWLYETPGIVQLPAELYYTSAQILRLVTDEETTVEEVVEETKRALPGFDDYLPEYLPRLHEDLPIMWRGAKHSLYSDNPDRIRHFITSLRELFNHVLHILAPDESSAPWLEGTNHFHDGRPTRQGRLLYICRNMTGSDKAFAKFMKADVESAVALIAMFQSGTHKIKSEYTEAELEMILLRAELSLRTFLKVEFDINRA